jgi:hypothetical protein
MVDRARLLNRNGYSVLLIDLSSHGESSCERITAGHLEHLDVRAAVDFLQMRIPEEPVAVIGVSLGGAATVLAAPLTIDACVLELVYQTIDEAIGNRIHQRLGLLSPIAKGILLLQMKMRLGISPAELRPVDQSGRLASPIIDDGGQRGPADSNGGDKAALPGGGRAERAGVFRRGGTRRSLSI